MSYSVEKENLGLNVRVSLVNENEYSKEDIARAFYRLGRINRTDYLGKEFSVANFPGSKDFKFKIEDA